MILYHGSYLQIDKPDIAFSRDRLDFGKGFYTTPIREQAEKWSIRSKRKYGQGIISLYEFNEVAMRSAASVLEFATYSEEWVEFIVSCRSGDDVGEYDVVIGGVANDDIFNTLQLFFRGFIDKSEMLKRLRYEKTNSQYCFRNQIIIDKYLKFITSEIDSSQYNPLAEQTRQ
ncbi:MAG: DUF3990 domain-containing protein [Bacteroidales bacterium]|jgi:hypothetical protein|nr:DUF3990 domain-containing protein [Bacteroidales bacterium]